MTENAIAIFVPIAMPGACRKCLPLKWNEFSLNVSSIKSPRVVDGGIGRLGR